MPFQHPKEIKMLTKISYHPVVFKTNLSTNSISVKNNNAQINFGMVPARPISAKNVEILEKIAEKLSSGRNGITQKTVNNKTITLNRFPQARGELTIADKNGSKLRINNIFHGNALNIEYIDKSAKRPSETTMRIAYGKDGKGYEFEPGEILRFKTKDVKKGLTINVERTYNDRSVVNRYFNDDRLGKLDAVLSKILPDALL